MGSNFYFIIAFVLALIAGYLHFPPLYVVASAVSEIFINLLKLVSIPIIFLSIVSTISGMENMSLMKRLGQRVVRYTLLTTIIAATIALFMFIVVNPVRHQVHVQGGELEVANELRYLNYLVQTIPFNAVKPFIEGQVIGVLFIAVLLGGAILTLPVEQKTFLHSFFSSLYAAIMKVTAWIVLLMPLAVWGFVTLFIRDLHEGIEIESLALYLACVVGSNLLQGLIALPLLLKIKGISPWKMAKGMFPALSVAFFTKSSSATLPIAMRCAEDNLKISKQVSAFAFPLCTTINMNACAAFILTTVLFVAMSNGVSFSPIELILWVMIATIAAVGNAGVPMGCYFLSSALLATMNIPLNILGVILPFYTLIDMLETAINVWSDSCVAAIVEKEISVQEVSIENSCRPFGTV